MSDNWDEEGATSWTPRLVWLNTLATILGACTGLGALAIALVALLHAT